MIGKVHLIEYYTDSRNEGVDLSLKKESIRRPSAVSHQLQKYTIMAGLLIVEQFALLGMLRGAHCCFWATVIRFSLLELRCQMFFVPLTVQLLLITKNFSKTMTKDMYIYEPER